MNIRQQITIDAPLEHVWNLVANQFDAIGDWVSPVHSSSKRPGPARIDGAPCAGRVCNTEMGPITEEITEFDATNGVIAYSAEGERMPFFVRTMHNRWTLKRRIDATTDVEMHIEARLLPPFGLLMGPIMKMQMGKMSGFAMEEIKHYAETGRVHARKAMAQSKAANEAA